jgi:outer membrane lipoprotein-sorting protein
MLKRLSLLMLAAVSLMVVRAQNEAPTVDQVLAGYFENTGGLDKWKALKSMKMEGGMNMQGMEFPGTVYYMRPNLQRVEVAVQGKQIIQAYDGETAWWINPFAGGTEAQRMPEEMAAEMVDQKFESEFIDYKEKGHTVEYAGTEEVEGANAHVIKLTKANGNVEHHYFDAEFMVPVMVKTAIKSGPTKGQYMETYMSDYQEVGGLMIPHFIETKMNGQSIQSITIKTVALDENLDAAMFDFPSQK